MEGNLKGGTEYTVRHDDGRLVDVRIYNAPVYREGVHCGFRGILIDVSDQKRDKEALRFSEEKFSKAFQKSPVWVNLSSLDDGRYLEVNAAFLESTGYERDQVIGKDLPGTGGLARTGPAPGDGETAQGRGVGAQRGGGAVH